MMITCKTPDADKLPVSGARRQLQIGNKVQQVGQHAKHIHTQCARTHRVRTHRDDHACVHTQAHIKPKPSNKQVKALPSYVHLKPLPPVPGARGASRGRVPALASI